MIFGVPARVVYDVVVVGGGPAGSSAARAAAAAGARTLLLDRAHFPRYKTCGGGLIGPTLSHLPAGFDLPVAQEIRRASFSVRGRREFTRSSDAPLLTLVNRTEFDARLLDSAAAAGAEVRQGVLVHGVEPSQGDQVVSLSTTAGLIHGRWVVGADGSASRLARYVGAQLEQTDLGLEVELEANGHAAQWDSRIHVDFGDEPGAYGWVFPKGDTLTVGVIMAKGRPAATKTYLADFVAQQGLSAAQVVRDSGHLTRCRSASSPLGRGRILLAGDAAGLLEPWTREGISYAVRSGLVAGSTAAAAVRRESPAEAGLAAYTREITSTLGREMAAGRPLLKQFEQRPGAFHAALRYGPGAWKAFCRITTGERSLADLVDRPIVGRAVER